MNCLKRLSASVLLLGFGIWTYGQNVEFHQNDLLGTLASKPVSIMLKNGNTFEGVLDSFKDTGFSISQSVGAEGLAVMTFVWEDIDEVGFEGDGLWEEIDVSFEKKEWKECIRIMRVLYEQRAPFFPILSETEIFQFEKLVTCYIEIQDPTAAMGLIRQLESWVKTPEYLLKIREHGLKVFLLSGMHEELVKLSRTMIYESPHITISSFPWVALGFQHLKRKRYREAWLCAIHPLLFDQGGDSAHISDAFMIAQIATLKMKEVSIALKYYDDMVEASVYPISKPYQTEWHDWWTSVDWRSLRENTDEIEKYGDIESDLAHSTDTREEDVPVIRFPVLQN
ncbi:MAG: hypothetical protein MI748_07450 [Opitutales bacterium]|nr:hypothetical protein [Opitutales bacterium]